MIKAVIFDMDGTILNTLEDLTDSLNYVLRENGFPERTIEEVKSFVGNGIHKLIERAVPPDTDLPIIENVYRHYVDYYRDHCNIKTKPYDGIVEEIKRIRSLGYLTAVVSNKEDKAVKELCLQLFDNCFDESLGDTKGIKLKPERDMIDIVLKRLGINSSEAVYVGDSDVDILTAKNASMECISVSWGFRTTEFLKANGAKIIVDKPQSISPLLLNIK